MLSMRTFTPVLLKISSVNHNIIKH